MTGDDCWSEKLSKQSQEKKRHLPRFLGRDYVLTPVYNMLAYTLKIVDREPLSVSWRAVNGASAAVAIKNAVRLSRREEAMI